MESSSSSTSYSSDQSSVDHPWSNKTRKCFLSPNSGKFKSSTSKLKPKTQHGNKKYLNNIVRYFLVANQFYEETPSSKELREMINKLHERGIIKQIQVLGKRKTHKNVKLKFMKNKIGEVYGETMGQRTTLCTAQSQYDDDFIYEKSNNNFSDRSIDNMLNVTAISKTYSRKQNVSNTVTNLNTSDQDLSNAFSSLSLQINDEAESKRTLNQTSQLRNNEKEMKLNLSRSRRFNRKEKDLHFSSNKENESDNVFKTNLNGYERSVDNPKSSINVQMSIRSSAQTFQDMSIDEQDTCIETGNTVIESAVKEFSGKRDKHKRPKWSEGSNENKEIRLQCSKDKFKQRQIVTRNRLRSLDKTKEIDISHLINNIDVQDITENCKNDNTQDKNMEDTRKQRQIITRHRLKSLDKKKEIENISELNNGIDVIQDGIARKNNVYIDNYNKYSIGDTSILSCEHEIEEFTSKRDDQYSKDESSKITSNETQIVTRHGSNSLLDKTKETENISELNDGIKSLEDIIPVEENSVDSSNDSIPEVTSLKKDRKYNHENSEYLDESNELKGYRIKNNSRKKSFETNAFAEKIESDEIVNTLCMDEEEQLSPIKMNETSDTIQLIDTTVVRKKSGDSFVSTFLESDENSLENIIIKKRSTSVENTIIDTNQMQEDIKRKNQNVPETLSTQKNPAKLSVMGKDVTPVQTKKSNHSSPLGDTVAKFKRLMKNITVKRGRNIAFDEQCKPSLGSLKSSAVLEKDSVTRSSGLSVCSITQNDTQLIKRMPLEPGKEWKRAMIHNSIQERESFKFCRSFISYSESFSSSVSFRSQRSSILNGTELGDHTSLYQTVLFNGVQCEDNEYCKQKILEISRQEDVLMFEQRYPTSSLKKCKKIGEGVYGEVFKLEGSVIKIMPIEGSKPVNGEEQKKFHEIFSEIMITKEMSDLQFQPANSTPCFTRLLKCSCVRGRYPDRLIQLWEDFDEAKQSFNNHPSMFTEDQLFIILELEDGGSDSGEIKYRSPNQTYSFILQVLFSLAVAEVEVEFEHRDLHMSNILVRQVEEDVIPFRLNNVTYHVKSQGVRATLIDFTISRSFVGDKIYFYDLSQDEELFQGEGDYQFDMYRMMRTECDNDWKTFTPKNNIFWLHYLLHKATTKKKGYQYTRNPRQQAFDVLHELESKILTYDSCYEVVQALCNTESDEFPLFHKSKMFRSMKRK